jgi:hypothetical protein
MATELLVTWAETELVMQVNNQHKQEILLVAVITFTVAVATRLRPRTEPFFDVGLRLALLATQRLEELNFSFISLASSPRPLAHSSHHLAPRNVAPPSVSHDNSTASSRR